MSSDIQGKLTELQMLKEQLKQYEEQAVKLMESGGEIQMTKTAIEEISKQKGGEEIMLPLGTGVYITAKLLEKSPFVAGIGGNVFVEKTEKDVIKLLDERLEKIEKGTNDISIQMQMLSSAIEKTNKDLETLAESQNKKK